MATSSSEWEKKLLQRRVILPEYDADWAANSLQSSLNKVDLQHLQQ